MSKWTTDADFFDDDPDGADAPLDESTKSSWVLRCCLLAVQLPRRCVVILFGFLWDWLRSRSRIAFWLGMPAVATAVVLVGLVAIARQSSRLELIGTYQGLATRALAQDDLKAAGLYYRKLSVLDPASAAPQHGLAVIAERQGDLAQTRELMQRIAPADGRGDSRAHFWLAQDMARNRVALDDTEAVALYEHHLQAVLRRQPNHAEVHQMLGELCAARKDFQQAALHFEMAAVAKDPSVLLGLARIYVLLGRRSDAQTAAKRASQRFQTLSEASPDRPELRLGWAQTEVFLLNYERAAHILAEGVDKADSKEDGNRFQQALATVFVAWYDRVSLSEPDSLARRLELLQQAMRFGPNDPSVLSRLASFTVQGDQDSEEARAAQSELKQVLASGAAPAVVHFILGTAGLGTDRQDQAIRHLELAFEQVPQAFAAANNLAWALAHADEPNLERAEQLIEAAVKLAPQHPEIRETRGVIHAKLGRTKEAIVDLEFALRAFPSRKLIHTSLASLYDELGDAELAQQHRELGMPADAEAETRQPAQ